MSRALVPANDARCEVVENDAPTLSVGVMEFRDGGVEVVIRPSDGGIVMRFSPEQALRLAEIVKDKAALAFEVREERKRAPRGATKMLEQES